MKIRLRLTLWFTGLVILIVCAGGGIGWLGVRNYSYSLAQTEIRDKQLEIQAFVDSLVEEFARRFARKGQRGDALGRRAQREQPHEAVRQRIGFPGARRRQDHDVTDFRHRPTFHRTLSSTPW